MVTLAASLHSQPAGGELIWDGKDEHAVPAPPGIYVYRLDTEIGRHHQEGKLVVVR